MNANELLLGRRSIRRYKSEIVSRTDIDQIMELTRFAQSWANTQTARYTIVTDEAVIGAVMERGVQGFSYNVNTLKHAKNIAILSYVTGKSGVKHNNLTSEFNPWESFDAGISCQTFCLAAHSIGVGTCVMGVIDTSVIGDIINLPEGEKVAALITFGYPDEAPAPTPRKSAEEITRFIG